MHLIEHPRLVEEGAHDIEVVEHHGDMAGNEPTQPFGGGPTPRKRLLRRILEEARPSSTTSTRRSCFDSTWA